MNLYVITIDHREIIIVTGKSTISALNHARVIYQDVDWNGKSVTVDRADRVDLESVREFVDTQEQLETLLP